MNENIEKILSLNLTKEQKEALLGQLADELIEKNNKTDFDIKREELMAKEREKAENTRKRLKEYEENSLKEENQRKRNEELEEKIKVLSEITDENGKKIYSDLSNVSGYRIDSLYNSYIEKDKEKNSSIINDLNDKDNVSSNVTTDENKTRELTPSEAQKVLELANRIGPLTSDEQKLISDLIIATGVQNQDELINNVKALTEPIEKIDVVSESKDDNYRELTLKEARSVIGYVEQLDNGKLSEEEVLESKPTLDKLIKETGAKDIDELYDKACKVVEKNKSSIENSTEKESKFYYMKDVGELTEEDKKYVRNELGLDENAEIEKKHLDKIRARLFVKEKKDEGRKPVKRIGTAGAKLKKIIDSHPKIASAVAAVGAVVALGVAIATGVAIVPGLAAGALGLKAAQEFNKGRKQ
ncbi:MAG: hypothetical protein ACI31R_00965 [Bacilli bacterium]